MEKNINKRFKELQPYVLGMRFNKELTVIDTMFKDGWSVPKSDSVGFEVMDDKPNYYMLYPLIDEVGIDEILDYVSYIIKLNIERELKYNLLIEKVKELEELFKQSNLEKCKSLQFIFSGNNSSVKEGLSLKDMPLDIINNTTTKKIETPVIEIKAGEPPLVETVDREVSPDIEEWNKRANSEIDFPTAKVGNEVIDLPPKTKKVELEEFNSPNAVCRCDPRDPNQVCPVCYESKL